MFDRKVERHYHEYFGSDNNVSITEHRAPTDESIRLAEEYKEKAIKSIISNEYVKNNTFEYRVLVYEGPYFDVGVTIVALLNGKRYEVSEDISRLVKRHLIKKETIRGSIYDYDIDTEQLTSVRLRILTSILLKSMLDFSEKDFNILIDGIKKQM